MKDGEIQEIKQKELMRQFRDDLIKQGDYLRLEIVVGKEEVPYHELEFNHCSRNRGSRDVFIIKRHNKRIREGISYCM